MSNTNVKPLRNASARALLALPKQNDINFISKMAEKLTREEFAEHVHRGHGCPHTYNLKDSCQMNCKDCWSMAVADIPFYLDNPIDVVELQHIELRYHAGKTTCVALVKDTDGKLVSKGVARKHFEDTNNPDTGKLVSLIKALGISKREVLSQFTTTELAYEVARRL